VAKAVAAGQIGRREAIRGGEGHLDGAGGRQVWAEAWAGLPIESGERTHRDRLHREIMLLEDDETDTTAGGGIDAIPAEELFHRDDVMRLVGLTEIIGKGTETVRIPPAPSDDQRDAE